MALASPSARLGAVAVHDDGAVRFIRLDRAARRNALDLPTVRALHAALLDAEAAGTVRAVVLSGDGPAFCAGGDRRETEESGLDIVRERLDLTLAVLELIPAMSKPVAAAVAGAAIGGGAGLALACDLIVADDTTSFGYPGLGPTPVGRLVLAMLRDAVGARAAFAILAGGQKLDARAMLAAGLAHAAVPAGQHVAAAGGIAATWAASDPAHLATLKRLLRPIAGAPT